MIRSFGFRVLLCIGIAGITLYAHIDKRNEITQLRKEIPVLQKEVKELQTELINLQYEIDRFESPLHLMELARKPEFSHLKYPYQDEVIQIPQAKYKERK